LGSFSQISLAVETTVTTLPENPEAYEPFIIQVTSARPGVPFAIDMAIDSGQIDIGYLSGPSGFIDPHLTLGAVVSGLPAGEYDIDVEEIRFNDVGLGQVTIAEAPPSIPAYSMYLLSGVQHYFLTADEAERDEVLDTDFGYIVDEGFNVWPAEGPAP